MNNIVIIQYVNLLYIKKKSTDVRVLLQCDFGQGRILKTGIGSGISFVGFNNDS